MGRMPMVFDATDFGVTRDVSVEPPDLMPRLRQIDSLDPDQLPETIREPTEAPSKGDAVNPQRQV